MEYLPYLAQEEEEEAKQTKGNNNILLVDEKKDFFLCLLNKQVSLLHELAATPLTRQTSQADPSCKQTTEVD